MIRQTNKWLFHLAWIYVFQDHDQSMIMTRYDSWHNLSKFMRTWSATPSLFSTMIVLYYTELIIFFAIWNYLHFYFFKWKHYAVFLMMTQLLHMSCRSFQVSLSVWGHSPQLRQNQITYTQTSIVSTDLRWTPQISWHCLIMLFTPTKEKEMEKIQFCFVWMTYYDDVFMI